MEEDDHPERCGEVDDQHRHRDCRAGDAADRIVEHGARARHLDDLIDQLAEFSRPIFVISGGEPLMRDDFGSILSHAVKTGFLVAK